MKHAYLPHLTPEEYLAFEEKSDAKHEYLAGQIYAMVGVKDVHNLIAGNIYSQLRTKLRGGPYRVFVSDVKVQVEKANAFYYPDIFVTCDPRDTDPYIKRHPCLIVEVISPSTEATDRREKLVNYRTLESLEEYLLVSQEQKLIDVYRKEAGGGWGVDTLTEGDVVQLMSLGVEFALAEVYEDVHF